MSGELVEAFFDLLGKGPKIVSKRFLCFYGAKTYADARNRS